MFASDKEEFTMSRYLSQPRMTKTGVLFTIRTDREDRECLISREALERLSAIKNIDASDAESIEIFHAFEATIDSVARRMADEAVRGPLLVLQPAAFNNPAVSASRS
jgi:Protein of unknown function (DUF1488)